MKISIDKIHFLNAVCDDFENLESISKELGQLTGKEIIRSEFERLAAELIKFNLVEMYTYDSNNQNYVVTEDIPKSSTQTWFYITQKGRVVLDENWMEDH